MPITIGKKCPRCKEKKIILRNKAWPYQFPGIKHFTCSTCRRDFFHIPPCSILIDKRTNKRVETPSTLLVRIQGRKGDQSQFARIEDISMEGIAFSYDLDLQKFTRNSFTIDIYNCKLGTLLKKLPIEVVYSQVSVKKISGKQTTILRTGARFGQLNHPQKKILQNFIDGFSTQT